MNFLYDQYGRRKYLTIQERNAFLEAAKWMRADVYTFCALLAYSGARISEILALVPARFDFSEEAVVIECLKKRRRGVNRTVPLPASLLKRLDDVHTIRLRQRSHEEGGQRLWPWCRATGWGHVKATMEAAGISGPHACPKGLRHSFGVSALQMETPINMVQRWLGHCSLATTAIYAEAIGEEERVIARRFWASFPRRAGESQRRDGGNGRR
ncbi:MAG: site-specific integrase [Rhodospirillales bacterium]|nr:site-specific integrase [Rhodospirillales bacterium]